MPGSTGPIPDSDQLLASVLNSSPNGIMAFATVRDDAGAVVDFMILAVNHTAEKIIARQADTVIGRRLLEVFPGVRPEGLFDAYVRVATTGQPFRAEHYYARDGLDHWFDLWATPCGEGIALTFSDITANKAAAQRLRESAERLAEAEELARLGHWEWDPATNRINWSDQTKRIFGVPLDQPAPDFEQHQKQIHPDDLPHWRSVVERAMADHQPYVMRFRAVLPGGSVNTVESRGRCELGPDGGVRRMFGTVQDITEKKAAEDELWKLSMVAERTEDGVVVTDNNRRIEWVNRAFTQITGYTLEEMRGQVPGKLLQGENTDPATVARIRESLARGEGFREKLLNYRKSGEPYWIEVEVRPIHDEQGRLTNYMAIERDVTEMIHREQALKDARDQAERANTAKSAFLANMSHEIRTPMTAILGYADLLLDPGQNESDRRNHAHTIVRNGRHLLDILNDVLDLSKIEAGRMSVEHIVCRPQRLFADVISMMRPKAMEKGIDLGFEAAEPLPQHLRTDPTRLRQVLLNLVSNAIKFTNTGSVRVVARTEPGDHETQTLRIDVTDTGIGISEEQLARLFKPFSQADESTTRTHGGTGLGLVISHNLCRLLGGGLVCTSTPDAGSTFTATIRAGIVNDQNPVDPAPVLQVPLHGDMNLGRIRVLLVEDAVDNQRLISHYLCKAGATVLLAENGRAGVEAALAAEQNGEGFGVVLMDMQMPVLDGYDATQQLRAAGYARPILALTAHASEDDRQKCLAAGCSDYLTKPVDRQKLIRAVASHVAATAQAGSGI